MVFNDYEWTPYADDLEICYQMEDKGIKDDKGRKEGQVSDVRVSLAPDVP